MEVISKDDLIKEIDAEIEFWDNNGDDKGYDACMVVALEKIRRMVQKMPTVT